MVPSVLWVWSRDAPLPEPVTPASDLVAVAETRIDVDEPLESGLEESIPLEETKRELESASREAFARRPPGSRVITGVTRAADTGWPVRCFTAAYDAENEAADLQRSASLAGGFAVVVGPTAQRLEFTPRRRLDLQVASIDLPAHGDVTDLDVVLVRARGSIAGQVIDEQGQPLAGVRVRLNGDHAFRTTGEAGTFRFGPLRDDSYFLQVPTPAFATSPSESSRTVRVVEGRQVESVLFVVVRGATLRGTVVAAETGQPIDGIRIVLGQAESTKDHRSLVTDERGEFEMSRLVAGSYRLTATDERGSRGRQQLLIDNLQDEVRTIVVEMASGAGRLAGRLVDADGGAVPFAQVVVRKLDAAADERSWTTRSDSRGRFQFGAIPSGTWWVGPDPSYCEVHNWLADAGTEVVVRDGVPSEVDIELRAGAFLSGRVVSDSRRPGLLVRLRRDEEVREERVGHDGHFAFGGVRAGQYIVEALDDAHRELPLAQQLIYVQSGESSSVHLRVP